MKLGGILVHMQTLLAVIDDLFQFAFSSVFGHSNTFIRSTTEGSIDMDAMQMRLLPASAPVALKNHPALVTDYSVQSSNTGGLHFIGIPNTALHTDPVMAFDVVTNVIAYGEEVHLLKLGGRWAYVRYKDTQGWVLKDALREQAKDIYPQFEEGSSYGADDEVTKKLRLCIDDSFCGERAGLLLTDAEYVTYKLKQKQLALPWGNIRPRTPGAWQKLLRGKQGVHMSIQAQTGSVMEYVVDDVGYVLYVEAVFPDESIKVSSVGVLEEGTFTVQTLSKEEYRELHPIFISAQ